MALRESAFMSNAEEKEEGWYNKRWHTGGVSYKFAKSGFVVEVSEDQVPKKIWFILQAH